MIIFGATLMIGLGGLAIYFTYEYGVAVFKDRK